MNGTHLLSTLACDNGAWVSVTQNPTANKMVGGDAIVIEPRQKSIWQAYLTKESLAGVNRVGATETTISEASFEVARRRSLGSIEDAMASVESRGLQAAEPWTASWTRPLTAGSYQNAQPVPPSGASTVVVAWGAAGEASLTNHGNKFTSLSINFATGAVSVITSTKTQMLIAHGVLMALAWAFLFPIGAIASRARSRLQAPSSPLWFTIHRVAMMLGWVLLIIALALSLSAKSPRSGLSTVFNTTHGAVGIAAAIVGLLQPINAFIRPKKSVAGTTDTQLRISWEAIHKGLGWFAIGILAPTAIFTGMMYSGFTAPSLIYAYAVIFGLTILAVIAAFVDSTARKLPQQMFGHSSALQPCEDPTNVKNSPLQPSGVVFGGSAV